MTMITLEEAQSKLPEVIGQLSRGQEIAVTQGGHVVARIVGERAETRRRPEPGMCRDMIIYMAPDFDETPEEFKDYLE